MILERSSEQNTSFGAVFETHTHTYEGVSKISGLAAWSDNCKW